MTDMKLLQAAGEGLLTLHTKMVEQGAEQREAAEAITEAAMRLWPELDNIYIAYEGDYDEDDLR